VLIYHGSLAKFTSFKKEFKHTGEGAGSFHGFYFAESEYGAKFHIRSPLRSSNGYIYVCEIPDRFLSKDIEWSDGHYRGEVFGVGFENLSHLSILEIRTHEIVQVE
jgi:hypothetical protein